MSHTAAAATSRAAGCAEKKLEIVQLWRCSSCKRTFTPGPAALHNKTYPLRDDPLGAHGLRPRLQPRSRLPHVSRRRPIAASRLPRSPRGSSSTSSIAAIADCEPTACATSPPSKPYARSSSITARSTATPSTARSLSSCARDRSTTSVQATDTLRPSRTFSKTSRPLARTTSSAATTTPKHAHRRPRPLGRTPLVSS